ncbi:MAG: inorganic phosphate transporter [Spirochaetales bacterium]|nr:inorganic phosphate transporter [Spirochaetales bacterium]
MNASIVFLTSGLFLGWSLGANDAANIFGTAVGTKMIRFKTAAIISSIFVVIGAVVGGAGTSSTIGKLGEINQLPGAFVVALSAALAVFVMTKTGVPVSTSQAIIGGIVAWNFFAAKPTDGALVRKIVATWIICPLLAALFAIILYIIVKFLYKKLPTHIIMQDEIMRLLLIITGAFGAYSLGANNIGNVMGVFINSSPFEPKHIGFITISSEQILLFLGGIAIAIGIATYSKKVMLTVGNDIFKLSPATAFVTVTAQSLVLFIFSSEGLNNILTSLNLPNIPLVPVSSSQAIVGAVIGIGLVKGWRNLRFGILGKISIGWILTPIIAGLICYILLFVMQNLFLRQVF